MEQQGGEKGYGLSDSGGPRSHTGHIELTNRSHNRMATHGDSKGFVHMRDDYVSETATAGSLHGSENDLVQNNGIIVKQEYEVRVEGRDANDLPIMQP